MWIIPKLLHTSAYVQDMAALISDYQELSELCEQSLLVRSKPLPVKTWSRRWKQAGSMPHLSGRILKPSLGRSFATRWTSCQVASLVSHSHQQADEQETMTQDTFGLPSSEESESWHTLPLFSLKMLRGSSQASSRAMDGPILSGRLFCSMSSASWRDWVIKQRQDYSQRVKSVRPTNENECSLWVCAPISATQGALLFQSCSAPQSEDMWLTPATTAGTAKEPLYTAQGEPWTGEGRAYRKNGMHRTLTLNMQVDAQSQSEGKIWGTARVGASNAPAGGGNPSKKDHKYRLENQVQPTQPQEVQSSMNGNRPELQGKKHKLNPRWVETLMGLPIGWTMPSCANPWTIEQMSCACSEMESCQRQQSEPFESCGTK